MLTLRSERLDAFWPAGDGGGGHRRIDRSGDLDVGAEDAVEMLLGDRAEWDLLRDAGVGEHVEMGLS
jgi:hypothetical protein